MKYIRNFSEHSAYEAEKTKIPSPSVSYCRKENECHFMPNNVIMFKVGDLNGNTNQTVTVFYYEGGSETIPITEGNKWYVYGIQGDKHLKQFVGIKNITDSIISARIKTDGNTILKGGYGNVSFIGCDTSDMTGMFYMFNDCSSLQSLGLSNWDTSKVTYMGSVFSNCSSLQTLGVSGWNTSKVTNMSNMFTFCTSLQTLDVSNWNVGNVTDMTSMFMECKNLQTLDLSGWDTSKVTYANNMFNGCKNLQTLDLSGWDTSKLTYMGAMFHICEKLKTIYMRNCNQTTIDKIKAQLKTDGILGNVTIITE